MSNTRPLLRISLFAAFLLPLTAAQSQQPERKAILVAEALGDVIDAEENNRLNIFPREIGLLAARIYPLSSSKWHLHLLGESADGGWMIVETISQLRFENLQRLVASRINRAMSDEAHFDRTIHPVDIAKQFQFRQPLEIELAGGSRLFGQINKAYFDRIDFTTTSGTTLEISEQQVLEIRVSRGIMTEQGFMKPDPNEVRLFFGPTGRTLRQGEGQVSDFYVLFPTAAVGITDNFMIGAGMSLVPFADNQVFYISPKIRFVRNERVNVAAGFLYMGVPNEGGIGAAYTAVSTGNSLGGVTLGLAVPIDFQDELESFIGVLFGGEKKVSSKMKLITENWLFAGNGESALVVSGGLRFIGDRLTVGLGLWTIPELINDFEGFPLIPWLDFSLNFGR